ncbi:MAG: hypothetical protein ABFS34_10140 [Gemmatimonadota bacterium]
MAERPTRVGSGSAFWALGLGLFAACSDGTAPPPPAGEPDVRFTTAEISIGSERSGQFTLRNDGDAAAGPVELRASQIRDGAQQPALGASVILQDAEIATLNAGASRTVAFSVDFPEGASPGSYEADVTAHLAGEQVASLRLNLLVAAVPGGGVAVVIGNAPALLVQGDVAALSAVVTDSAGDAVSDPSLAWRVEPLGAGLADASGQVVGYEPGTVRVIASVDAVEDTVEIAVEPRGLSGSFTQVGLGPVPERFSSDLWVFGANAYSGTWGFRTVDGTTSGGNQLLAWNISSPAAPARTDSITIDARVVNDVKVSADGALAVATHESSSDGENGVTLLDLADPDHPTIIARFKPSDLLPGVHNVWIDGNQLYVVVDGGAPTSGLRIVDVSDPGNPAIVSQFYAGSSFLHDVIVRDGFAFLSHWNAGLVILDVGNGLSGGSPSAPVEVSRITLDGQTHNAWYWPAAGYLFVGEEDTATPGIVHVLDVSNLSAPRRVATLRVPGDTPHNFWLDEAAGVLYVAWYSNGLRAVDVSGELLGALERQGREIAFLDYGTDGGCPGSTDATCTWAPQVHGGEVWVSDMNQGLFSFSTDF